MECFARLLEIKPNREEVLNNIGSTSKHIGEDGAAITYFQRALEIRPDVNKAQPNLAAAFLEAEKVEDAIEIYRAADPKATMA